MALSININVNNSDISIKNSKTGAKKNIKSISAGNLNDMTDREFNISQKRKIARKQAMKLISDAWDKDNKAAQGIKDMESEKADIANINADLKSKLKDIDKSQKDLQELYGVHSESQEQKDLELLKKYQDNRNGVSNDKFSKEEIDRLKELQNYKKMSLSVDDVDLEIGDIVGGREYITGTVVKKPVTNKILQKKDGTISIEYKLKGEQ